MLDRRAGRECRLSRAIARDTVNPARSEARSDMGAPSMSWVFHRSRWGQGFATEAATAALGWAWEYTPIEWDTTGVAVGVDAAILYMFVAPVSSHCGQPVCRWP